MYLFFLFSLFLINLFKLTAHELMVATLFRNEAPYLKEWIEYHHMVGVGHFLLYNDLSTDNWEEVLQPYIEKGLVEVFSWSEPQGSHAWVDRQVCAFRDAIARCQGNTTWIALIDLDEFLLPLRNKNVPECLNLHFSNASGVYINWRNFGTSKVVVPRGQPFLFKLTECSLQTHSDNAIGKSIVRPEHVDLEKMWYPHHFPLKSGFHYVNGDGQPLYFMGTDLVTDGKNHSGFMQINHYALRDEWYYQNVRLARAKQGFGNKERLEEHYDSFSQTKDPFMTKFIKKNYPSQYKRFWKLYE